MKRRSTGDTGAALVEAAITIPTFLAVVFFTIDISRYFFISYMLEYAAFKVADVISKDRRIKSDLSAAGTAQDRSDYLALYQEANAIALKYGGIVASAYNAPSSAAVRFLKSSVLLPTDFPPCPASNTGSAVSSSLQATNFLMNVAVIRPGEQAYFYLDPEDSSKKLTVSHNFRGTAYESSNRCYQGWPHAAEGETWESVCQSNPVQVEIRALMEPLTPFFPKVMISVKQFAYCNLQDPGFQQPYKPFSQPPPTATPGNTATPTATVDPYGPPPADTPTPTPTNTLFPPSVCQQVSQYCTSQTCCYRPMTIDGEQKTCGEWTIGCGRKDCSGSSECR